MYFNVFSVPFIGRGAVRVEYGHEIVKKDILELEVFLSESYPTYNILEIINYEKV